MKQEKRGGRRENSGRPKKENKRLRLHITLPPDLHAKIKQTGEASTIIEELLTIHFDTSVVDNPNQISKVIKGIAEKHKLEKLDFSHADRMRAFLIEIRRRIKSIK